ncbi:MAG: 1-deoxy-D-xylulose-5-phosphate reductoisomerase [Spirochaetaceae bacterium]|jgi:1-deoxy-D-xylulose-5-phosphate reductoisomerase|nr:1-deoxy-D-xylulose-5-phosphate reductoisomerase [Spirochaetaceae bacterium]
MKKKVAVLGAAGSIGKSTIDVLRSAIDDFEPVLFTTHTNADALAALANEFPSALIALSSESESNSASENSSANSALKNISRNKIFFGKDGLLNAIKNCGADIVLHGIAGSAGLDVTLAVLESGADLALANKETVVMAWDLVKNMADLNKCKIIPVDSEHSAVFSLINAHCESHLELDEIILTASGGPFRNVKDLNCVTVEDALAHPTWNMGAKITIDSASLANKGLEVIEAVRLFNMPCEKVSVVIHPQSIVHSMIRKTDGTVYAEMSNPDMRLPIHKALYFPLVKPCPFARLDFNAPLSLSFDAPDFERFPMLRLAYESVKAGAAYTIAYNAANEVAVAAFIAKKITFPKIPHITSSVLDRISAAPPIVIGDIYEIDKKARSLANELF